MRTCLLLLALAAFPAFAEAQDAALFDTKRATLRQQSHTPGSRDVIVGQYIELVDAFPMAPRRAEAMFDIAGILDREDPKGVMKRDPVAVLSWLRKTVVAATPASETWY